MRRTTSIMCLAIVSSALHAQDQGLNPAEAWATLASYQIRVFPNPELDPLASPGLVYYRVGDIDLRVSVYTPGPETVKRPTVLYIHGGGWVHYTRDNMIFSLLPYLARGMDVVNVDYRQANQARAPAAVEDCRCALHWVFHHANQFGFDTDRLVVAGGSAGGHLALMTGMLPQSAGFDDGCAFSIGQEPVKVSAIVDFFGPTDVAQLMKDPSRQSWAVEWFAGVEDPAALARRVSPLTYVRPGLPPTIIVHGTRDDAVPYQQSARLHQAFDSVGVPNELVTIENGGHGSYPDSEKLHAQAEIFRFLEKYGIIEKRR